MKNDQKQKFHLSHLTADSIDHTANSIIWYDSNGGIVHANKTACKMLSYTHGEFLKMNIYDINNELNKGDWHKIWTLAKKDKEIKYDTVVKDKTGIKKPVEVTFNYIEFEGKGYACSFLKDFTEQKKVEEAVRESEKRYQDIFNAVKDAIFIIDPETQRIVNTNHVAVELLGYTDKEIRGLPIEIVHPKEMKELVKILEFVLAGRPVVTDEFSCLRKDKKRIPADISFSSVILDGKNHVMAMVRDISERKKSEDTLRKSEDRYRSLYIKTPAMLHSIDSDGRITEVSDYWLEVLGYERSEVIGRMSVDFLVEESKKYAKKVALPEFFKTGIAREVPYQFVKKSGEIVDILLSGIPQFVEDGSFLQSLAVLVDVTERNRAENALQDALIQLKQLKNRLQAENIYLQSEIKLTHNFQEIISRSAQITKVLRKVEQVASTEATVMILGETEREKNL